MKVSMHLIGPTDGRKLYQTFHLSIGQPKVKIFLLLQKCMKHPQTKFHADTMSHFKVIRLKKVKIYH